jgi:t-SNARE complex subunit (syntaxin)
MMATLQRTQLQTERWSDAQILAAVVEERDEKINQLCAGFEDVHQIMVDLAAMTHEQTQMVDTIEAHIEDTLTNTNIAVTNLREADAYQQSTPSVLGITGWMFKKLFF